MKIKDSIWYIQIDKENYDFQTATDESRLSVRVFLGEDISAELRAASENCDVLRDIVVTRLRKQMK